MIVIKISNLSNVCPYDIGDILQTVNSTSPSTRWPGTEWEAIQTFLVGASSEKPVNSTGGEWTHTLTVNELARHNHLPVTVDTIANWTSIGNMWRNLARGPGSQGDVETKEGMVATSEAGGSQPHNNTPPLHGCFHLEKDSLTYWRWRDEN